MIIESEKGKCCGCYACINICPRHCIEMVADHEGFLYPRVNPEQCIHCGACSDVCPVNGGECIDENEKEAAPQFDAYVAYNRTEDVRLNSSSGGIFRLLADAVLDSNGIVYGAAMSEDCRRAEHIAVSNKEELIKLQGSKYLQSEIGSSYSEVKEQLERGRQVLFTGTPCQIEGLKSFLGRDYYNLVCVDIVCHGVPSQKVWEKHLIEIEKKNGSKAKQVSFRNKKFGWRMYSIYISFANGRHYQKIMKEDLFGQAYLQNICLRPSCHACAFKKINRVSDITIADCWNTHHVVKDDDKGLSLVLAHTVKGRQLVDKMREQAVFVEVLPGIAVKGNESMYSSALPHPKREAFFSELDIIQVDELIKKYVNTRKTIKWRVRAFVKKMGIW